MRAFSTSPFVLVVIGFALGVGYMYGTPPEAVKAMSANSNDKFSMATVPVTLIGNSEAVFVLDHLTGVLRGGILDEQSAGFTTTFFRSVAADFQLNPATPEPKYSMVGGPVNLRASGGNQPANGVLYVAELTSGAVVAYGFVVPRRNQAGPLELVRLDGFPFREAAGR